MSCLLRCAALIASTVLASATLADPAPVMQERLHVLYDPINRAVERRMVRVADLHPELNLAFHWEPAEGNWPGVSAAGLAEGPGVLVWRIDGLAAYDPRAMHHRFEGRLKSGRFDGQGRLSYRDGATLSGIWSAGQLQGQGQARDAAGNLYEGGFHDSQFEGRGIWRGIDGQVYEGGFHAGLRHGDGQITEPGGLRYAVRYDMGQLVTTDRPNLPDPLIAGLLPAQGGDSASQTMMTVAVDQRVSANLEMQYVSSAHDGQILIYPTDKHLQSMWNGQGALMFFDYYLNSFLPSDWDESRAFVLMDLATLGGSRERIKSLDLEVKQSVPHLQPMLRVDNHSGCVGFRPSFSLRNFGWGAVESASAKVRFIDPNFYDPKVKMGDEPGSGTFDLNLGDIDQGIDVWVRDVLALAGVDVARLEAERFYCPSADLIDQCRADTKASVNWGQIAPYVDGYDGLGTKLQGQISYNWTDFNGDSKTSTQMFEAYIPLLKIEAGGPLAECGGSGAFAAEAPTYQHIELPAEGRDYSVNLPLRGNPNTSRLLSGLALWSEKTAWHQMQIKASFADGSQRLSPILQLFFLHPRQPNFTSQTQPASCYLSEDSPSC
ncbi:hypothetical protein [Pseudooceanicola sp.]|uniref:hypothetical protein n=1 Tax=Pseudooceanicola sp. TaxID=1914328 RepID=UPI00263A016B|nr:hypothetical protein [Pseudooceanicola sp.]MDF1856176.1 hypothetical protein [Pseudooceanicola sp.]